MSEEERPEAVVSVPADGGTSGWMAADGDNETVLMSYRDLPGPSWTYSVKGRIAGGEVAVTSLSIEQRNPDSPEPITVTKIRSAPIGTALERMKRALHTSRQERLERLSTDVRTQHPKKGRSWPPEHYLQVAWYYSYAVATKRAPRKVIANHWQVSRITASRWLAETRRRGYLDSPSPRISLGRDPKFPGPPPTPPSDDASEIEFNQYKDDAARYKRKGLEAERKKHETTEMVEARVMKSVLKRELGYCFRGVDATEGYRNAAKFAVNIAGAAAGEVLGESDGSDILRSAILVEGLSNLAELDGDEQIQKPAAELLEALKHASDNSDIWEGD